MRTLTPPKNVPLYLVGLLSRREYSAAALLRKLKERGVPTEDAQKALEKIQELGLQSDTRYAELRARSMMSSGKGAGAARHELRRQGVPEEFWPSALTEADPDDELARARDWVTRRYGEGPWDDKTRRRVWGALMRRGFRGDTAQAAMRPGSSDED